MELMLRFTSLNAVKNFKSSFFVAQVLITPAEGCPKLGDISNDKIKIATNILGILTCNFVFWLKTFILNLILFENEIK